MTPDFFISIDGMDLTSRLRGRLLELTLQDEDGVKSDNFELKLDNGPDRIPLPKKGAKVRISLGTTERGLRDKGTYVVDEREVGADPGEYMLIRGKALDMTKNAKTKRTKTYEDKSVDDIVKDVSKRMGVEAAVDGKLSSKKIKHITQSNESDMHFLTRLAERFGAVFKPVDGKNVFAMRDMVSSLAGKPMTTVTIALGNGVMPGWKLIFQERGKYEKVKAKYQDFKTGKRETVENEGGEGDEQDSEISRTLHEVFGSKEEAQAAAQAEADRLKRGTGTGEFTVTWNPDIAAGSRCILSGFPDETDGNWKVKSVKHNLSDGGGTTSVSIETPKDKSDGASKGGSDD